MELSQLETFVAVAKRLSFVRAAEDLHLVQPAVSQQVKRLESELGVRLFDRTSRRVSMTAAGMQLLPEASAVLIAAQRLRDVAGDAAAAKASGLRIGTATGLGTRLQELVANIREAHPDLDVTLVRRSVSGRLDDVRSGGLHAAFVPALTRADGLEVLPAWDEPLRVAIPERHRVATTTSLVLADLQRLPVRLSARRSNPPFHDFVLTALATLTLSKTQLVRGPIFTNLQDALAEVGGRIPSWIPLYGDLPPVPGVVYREVEDVRVTTGVAVPPGPPVQQLRALLDALVPRG